MQKGSMNHLKFSYILNEFLGLSPEETREIVGHLDPKNTGTIIIDEFLQSIEVSSV